MTVVTASGAALLMLSAYVDNVYSAYILFIIFYAIMSFGLSCVSACVAHGVRTLSFSLIFTLNTFVSVLFQTVVQLAVGDAGMNMSVSGMYVVFAAQLCVVVVIYVCVLVYEYCVATQYEHMSATQET